MNLSENSDEWIEYYTLMARECYEAGNVQASWANLFFAYWDRGLS